MYYPYLLIPVLTIFACWMIVRIMRWMVFRPVVPLSVLGVKFQGAFPRYQSKIAEQAGNWAELEFKKNAASLSTLDFEVVRPVVELHMDEFLRNKLKEKMPVVGMLIGDRTIQDLKTIFIAEIEELFPRVMQEFNARMPPDLNIGRRVSDRIRSIPTGRLEELFGPYLEPLFKKARLLSILTGLLIAIIQLCLLVFVHP